MRICVVVKGEKSTRREDRPMGWWSYAVPQIGLEWEFIVPGKRFTIDTAELADQGFDAIVHEDFGTPGTYKGRKLPLIYQDIDSTLGDAYHNTRLPIAEQANLILVDQAPLDSFAHLGVPVYRFPYCVNDRLFAAKSAADRTIDVCLHQNKNENFTRQLIAAVFDTHICKPLNLVGSQGTVGYPELAANFSNAKVVLNWPRVPTNRPHRVFDAMAAGAALLTGPLPDVSGDLRQPNKHYRVFSHWGDLVDQIRSLIHNNEFESIAAAGQELVMAHHTWAIRAQQLRTILEAHHLWK